MDRRTNEPGIQTYMSIVTTQCRTPLAFTSKYIEIRQHVEINRNSFVKTSKVFIPSTPKKGSKLSIVS